MGDIDESANSSGIALIKSKYFTMQDLTSVNCFTGQS